MVGVAGSNPVVSTSIQHTFLIRDAEECRELAPALEFVLAEALGFLASRIHGSRVFQKQLRLLFCFLRLKNNDSSTTPGRLEASF